MYWRCNVLADTQLSITNSVQTLAGTMNQIIPGLDVMQSHPLHMTCFGLYQVSTRQNWPKLANLTIFVLWSSIFLTICRKNDVVCKVFSQAFQAIVGGMSLKFTTLYINLLAVHCCSCQPFSSLSRQTPLHEMVWLTLYETTNIPGWQRYAVNFGGVLAGNKVTLCEKITMPVMLFSCTCSCWTHFSAFWEGRQIFSLELKKEKQKRWVYFASL